MIFDNMRNFLLLILAVASITFASAFVVVPSTPKASCTPTIKASSLTTRAAARSSARRTSFHLNSAVVDEDADVDTATTIEHHHNRAEEIKLHAGKVTGTSFLPEETVARLAKGSPVEKAKLTGDPGSAYVDVYEFARKIREGEMTWKEVEKADLETVRTYVFLSVVVLCVLCLLLSLSLLLLLALSCLPSLTL